MRAIEERLRPHLDENVASLWLEKWLQIHAGGHPTVFFTLYRLLRTRKDLTRAVTPDKQVVIEGFPRSGNSFARRAFIMAQDETFDVTSIAHHLHVPAQVVRAAQWQIPTLVLIRRPRDAVLSLVIRDPISVDQALRYYISFYETSEKYRDAYVLGLFEEVTEDFGQVMKRINDRFGGQASTVQRQRNAVTNEWIDKGSGVPYVQCVTCGWLRLAKYQRRCGNRLHPNLPSSTGSTQGWFKGEDFIQVRGYL